MLYLQNAQLLLNNNHSPTYFVLATIGHNIFNMKLTFPHEISLSHLIQHFETDGS